MERRELIQWLVATTGGLRGLDALAPADLLDLGRDAHGRAASGTLSPRELRTVAVAAERILPGATAAGVGAFVDRMLADWHTPAERDRFLAGLPELDARCRALRGRAFVDCDEADQVAVLTALDDAPRSGGDDWFARLKYLTVYGYCTSEAGMRALELYPLAGRYDGCAPL